MIFHVRGITPENMAFSYTSIRTTSVERVNREYKKKKYKLPNTD